MWDVPTGVRPFKVHICIFYLYYSSSPERILPDQHGCHKPGDSEPENLAGAATEPFVTCSLSGPMLLALKEARLVLDLPATSVAVERGMKDVTDVVHLCVDSLERDGAVFQKVSSRKMYPLERRNKTSGT